MEHKHLLFNGEIANPVLTEEFSNKFLKDLVELIGMKILKGPFSVYLNEEGNRGLTGIVLIETSHISFHIWDEKNPGQIKLDLYTCGKLDLDLVLKYLKKEFTIISGEYILIDRSNGFTQERSGKINKD